MSGLNKKKNRVFLYHHSFQSRIEKPSLAHAFITRTPHKIPIDKSVSC